MPEVSPWADSSTKRALDLAAAVVLLLMSLPLLAPAAAAVAMLEGRPVLFRQERVGRDGETFVLYKIRTMRNDAAPPVTDSISTGSAAIFPLGAFLRRTKLDEVPQLYNVLRGEMSLIGPRPLPPELEVALPSETLAWRRRVRPGVTGLAQVRCGRRVPWAERVRHDVDYARQASPRLDLAIAFNTMLHLARSPDAV